MLGKITTFVLLGVTWACMMWPAGAAAHDPNWAYGNSRWPVGRDRLEFRFHETVRKGRFRDRISKGATEWNRYGRRVYFAPPSSSEPSTTNEPTLGCPQPSNTVRPSIVFYRHLVNGNSGLTFVCRKASDSTPFYFRMFFESSAPWWTDPNDNRKIPYNKADLQSVASHEFGHATGWGPHYDDDADGDGDLEYKPYCRFFNGQQTPDDKPYEGPSTQADIYRGGQTMCHTIITGSVHARTLGSHDRGTFKAAYGAR
jgi:hypothetical protein